MHTFDLSRPWQLHPQVAVRPEPFGALLYHFGTRRLSFLKDRTLLALVQQLQTEPSAQSACTAVGLNGAELRRYEQALGALAASSMVVERTP
ncbi:mycofactocin biosynthesis chaperone MftB [Arthrobacter sp. 7Tela_A1]|uniref:mycofactocin biosynthesis chaperone MftB n=1 Tax=Arthrobacter sp. 7Tela_A1 TaxID=3093745 RepID=UPI003BB4F453